MAWLKTRFESMPIFYSWKSRCSLLYNCDLIAVAFLIFISSLLYLYYFKESTGNHLKAMNDEFHLFLADLLPNVGISILFPVCIFARNPNLRRFTFQSIKDSIKCISQNWWSNIYNPLGKVDINWNKSWK